jgi:hypothetical protein
MSDAFPHPGTDLHPLRAAMITESSLRRAAFLQHPLGSLMRHDAIGHEQLFRFLVVCVGMAEFAVFPK